MVLYEGRRRRKKGVRRIRRYDDQLDALQHIVAVTRYEVIDAPNSEV